MWLTGQGGWAGDPLQKYVRIFFARQFFTPHASAGRVSVGSRGSGRT